MSFRIRLEKENFKFSVSHFTVLGPGKAERLHGHNYYVTLEIDVSALDPDLGMAFDFNAIKPIVRELTDKLDERILLPNRSPHLKIETKNGQVRAELLAASGSKAKHYEFPEDDVMILPVANVTSEELARLLGDSLIERLKQGKLADRIGQIAIGVQETRGQAALYLTKA